MNPSTFFRQSAKRRYQARWIADSRLRGLDIGEEEMGWDVEEEFDAERSGWADRVRSMIPRIEEDEMVLLRRIEKES